jgi:hypothetical protein
MYIGVNRKLSVLYGKGDKNHSFRTAFLEKCRVKAVPKAKFIYNKMLYTFYGIYGTIANLYAPTEDRDNIEG